MPRPAPLSFATSQLWDGDNGNWSSFIVRVGSPEQDFRVLPSPATGGVFIPDSTACQPNSGDRADCSALRGVVNSTYYTGFQTNSSTTWKSVGLFSAGFQSYLDYPTGASYGRDNVGLMVQNSGGPTLTDQIVGSLVKKQPFFVGFFGLSPKPLNFTNLDDPRPSYITSLKHQGYIPSVSYGYTAGARYKSPPVHGSLTLGGYDKNRFEPHNVTFPMDIDDGRPLSVALQHLTADNTRNGTASILQDAIYVRLDFTLPFLWLPTDACNRLASLFKLTYDPTSTFYLVEGAAHDELVASNPRFTFDLGWSSKPAERVSIVVPYAAFDLQASWPTFNGTKRYFPIRRAANESQYNLGRAFMQETYMIVDHEQNSFSLHQASFAAQQARALVAIPVKDGGGESGQHLSKGAIAGIVVGSVCAFAMVVVALGLWYHRRRRADSVKQGHCDGSRSSRNDSDARTMTELAGTDGTKHQLMGAEVGEFPESVRPKELQQNAQELPG